MYLNTATDCARRLSLQHHSVREVHARTTRMEHPVRTLGEGWTDSSRLSIHMFYTEPLAFAQQITHGEPRTGTSRVHVHTAERICVMLASCSLSFVPSPLQLCVVECAVLAQLV